VAPAKSELQCGLAADGLRFLSDVLEANKARLDIPVALKPHQLVQVEDQNGGSGAAL
jgi:hypothetical protein